MLPLVGIFGKAGSGKSTVAQILHEEFGVVPISLADPLKVLCKAAFPQISERQLFGPSAAREEAVLGLPDLIRSSALGYGQPADSYRELTHFAVENFGVDERSAERQVASLFKHLRERLGRGEPATARLVAQLVGTEFGRALDATGWVKALLRKADQLLEGGVEVDPATKLIVPQKEPKPCPGVSVPDCRFPNEGLAVLGAGGFLIRVVRPGVATTASVHASETAGDLLGDWAFSAKLVNDGTQEDLRAITRTVWEMAIDHYCPHSTFNSDNPYVVHRKKFLAYRAAAQETA